MSSAKQSAGMQEILKFSRIEEGTVEFTSEVNNQLIIFVRCEDPNIHNNQTPVDALTKAIPIDIFGNDGSGLGLTRITPKAGTRCLVMFKNPQDFTKGYYVGAINEPYSRIDRPQISAPEGSFKYINDVGSGYDIQSSGAVNLISKGDTLLSLKQNSLMFSASGDKTALWLNKDALRFTNDVFSLVSNNVASSLITKSNLIVASSNGKTTIGGSDGVLDFEGGKLTIKSSLFESTNEGFVVAAGYFKYKGISAKAFADATAPTYEVSILEGNSEFYNASGSFKIGILDPSSNEFLSFVGPIESAPMSKIQQKMTSIKMLVDVGGAGAVTSDILIDVGSISLEHKVSSLSTKATLDSTGIELDYSPSGKAANLKMTASSSRLEQDIVGSLMSLLELKVSGQVKVLGKNKIEILSNSQDIVIASGSLVAENITSPTLQVKLDSMMQRIEAKILSSFGLTVMQSETHGNPDVTAGLTPGAPFPINVSLRQHGHLTLVGPTITKLPADIVPI